MVIKGISGIKFAEPAEEPREIDPKTRFQVEQTIEQLDTADNQLEALKDYYKGLSLEDQAKIETLKARIAGEIVLLETYLKTGMWPDGTSAEAYQNLWSDLPSLPSGFHFSADGHDQTAMLEYLDVNSDEFVDYEDAVYEYNEDAVLEDVISVPNIAITSPDGIPPALALVLPYEKGEAVVRNVTGQTVGRDIYLTAEYEDGDMKTWILKGLAVRTDITLYISGQNCQRGFTLDMSRVIRVSENDAAGGAATANNIILIGGKGDDILIGSSSGDLIIGGEGDDRILGLGGDDALYGDGVFVSPETGIHSTNDASGGNDYIDGGTGLDITEAGGGANDAVVKDAHETSDAENTVDPAEDVDLGDLEFLYAQIYAHINTTPGGWQAEINSETSEIEITAEDGYTGGGSIVINIPDGYTLAYGEMDYSNNGWVITLAKTDEDDEGDKITRYLKVRIIGIDNSAGSTTVTLHAGNSIFGGSIIDLSRIKAGDNNVIIGGEEGVDTLIGAQTAMDELRINAEYLRTAVTYTSMQLEDMIPEITGEVDEDTDNAAIDTATAGSAEITITLAGEPDRLDLNAPAGFGRVDGVFYEAGGSDLIVYAVSVTNAEVGEFNLLRFRIRDGASDGAPIKVFFNGHEAAQLSGVEINGGEGADLVVGSIGSTLDWGDDEEDEVIATWYNEAVAVPPVGVNPTQDSDGDGVSDIVEEAMRDAGHGGDPNDGNVVPDGFTLINHEDDPVAEPETEPEAEE